MKRARDSDETFASDGEGEVSIFDDGSESDDDDESDEMLPLGFLKYCDDILNCDATDALLESESLTKAEKAIAQCKALIFHKFSNLEKMLQKASSRSDGKVPPGSAEVKRSLSDPRYLLSVACLNLSKLFDIRGDFNNSMKSLRDALVFFPRQGEVNEKMGRLLKINAMTSENLSKAESHFRKAIGCRKQICENIAALSKDILENSAFMVTSSNLTAAINSDTSELDTSTFELRILTRELESCDKAVESLCLMLCQSGEDEKFTEAVPLLHSVGFRWTLSREVLSYRAVDDVPSSSAYTDPLPSTSTQADECPALLVRQAIPREVIQHLCHVFRPASPYWSEHHYDALLSNASRTVGYFSYLYPFRSRSACCSIEQIIDLLIPLVRYVEPLSPIHHEPCEYFMISIALLSD